MRFIYFTGITDSYFILLYLIDASNLLIIILNRVKSVIVMDVHH